MEADNSKAATAVLSLAGGIITLIIGTVWGWWLRGNDARELESSARIDDAVKELDKIETLAITYWGRPADQSAAPTTMPEMIGRLHRLNEIVSLSSGKISDFERFGFDRALIELRQACTWEGSGEPHDKLPVDAMRVPTVLRRATAVLIILRRMRRALLPRARLNRIFGGRPSGTE